METIDDRSVSLEYLLKDYTDVRNLSPEEKKRRNIESDVMYVLNENIVYEKLSEEEKRKRDLDFREMFGEGTEDYKFWANLLEQL